MCIQNSVVPVYSLYQSGIKLIVGGYLSGISKLSLFMYEKLSWIFLNILMKILLKTDTQKCTVNVFKILLLNTKQKKYIYIYI